MHKANAAISLPPSLPKQTQAHGHDTQKEKRSPAKRTNPNTQTGAYNGCQALHSMYAQRAQLSSPTLSLPPHAAFLLQENAPINSIMDTSRFIDSSPGNTLRLPSDMAKRSSQWGAEGAERKTHACVKGATSGSFRTSARLHTAAVHRGESPFVVTLFFSSSSSF